LAGSERHLDHATNAVKLTAPIAGWRNTTRSGEASIRDSFTNGRPELDWLPYPNFNQDNLRGTIDETSPEGEAGVGVLDNKNVVGFAALSYAATISLSDFYLETWIHAQVTRAGNGPLNGIAFHIDTVSGNFYRVATQFMGAEPALSLAYVGKETNHYPNYLARWQREEIPGGAPQSSGSQKIAVAVQDSKAEIIGMERNCPAGLFP
jgi:hypothetical protein